MKGCVSVVANGLLLNMIDATNAVKTNDNNHGLCAQAALPPLYLLSPGCRKMQQERHIHQKHYYTQ